MKQNFHFPWCALSFAAALATSSSSASAAVAQFDVNDKGSSSPTLSGWTAVTGADDNANTITGSDGTHTLTLSTAGDGQDRDRGWIAYPSDKNLWQDFWFVYDSPVGGQTATATITGLAPNTFHTVEIWAYDRQSGGTRAAKWTDAVSGNSGASAFDGNVTPFPASLADSVATVLAKTNGAGVITLTGAADSGGSTLYPNIHVNAIRVDVAQEHPLPAFEAESGTLGSEFLVTALGGATAITISPSGGGYNPGSANRVASYAVQFPAEDTYHLYARIRVGPGDYGDDSFFYGKGFGVKSPTDSNDWVAAIFDLNTTGFTATYDLVTVGGGTEGTGIWKWIRFGTNFTVSGSLTQTFQVGGREDGFYMDKFVFAPSNIDLTVAELDAGAIGFPQDTVVFDGPDGIAIHRFSGSNQSATPDGANPASELVMIGGNLHGTTLNGGLQAQGAAFRLSTDGTVFETLKSFYGGANLAHPQGGLVVSGGGFFGVSQAGGNNGTGSVFELKSDGTEAIVRSFDAVAAHTATNVGGASPSGPIAVSGGTLYGAASAGGPNGNGTIFSVSTDGSGFTVRHDFSATAANGDTNPDGALPKGGVILAGEKLYGTTTAGAGGTGVVFSMDPDGANFTILHHFGSIDPLTAANADGAIPHGGLVESNGILYGTTLTGGAAGKGTLFAIDTDGANFLALYQFTDTASDGASPAAGLTLSGNVLYGTTSAGGPAETGTVFALDPFVPSFRTFHSFEPVAADGTNNFGAFPVGPVLRSGYSLFGTAFGGGPGGAGTVYRIPIPLSVRVSATANPNGTTNATFLGLGAPNSNYLIQATNDLNSWQNMTTQAADASGYVQYPESNLSSPRRFYRMAEAP